MREYVFFLPLAQKKKKKKKKKRCPMPLIWVAFTYNYSCFFVMHSLLAILDSENEQILPLIVRKADKSIGP